MNLPFSQKLNGKPTHFVEKIIKSIQMRNSFVPGMPVLNPDSEFYTSKYKSIYKVDFELLKKVQQKIHTIRVDEKNRWKEGSRIHAVINNRSKKQLQFVPTLLVESVQSVEMVYASEKVTIVKVDGVVLFGGEKEDLAANDGFDSFSEFIEVFRSMYPDGFTGKIIHWTNLKY